MRTFNCHCGNKIFFENSRCVVCGRSLAYLPTVGLVSAVEPLDTPNWHALHPAAGNQSYRMCANYTHQQVCNWMVAADDPDPFCLACRLNETIPDLSKPNHWFCWAKIEAAKRRLFYTLQQLRLPVFDRRVEGERGLAFAFLADAWVEGEFTDSFENRGSVTTGHARGLITINLAEADDIARARMRDQMQERYRTLLGHFRHEIGHYYWDLLVRDSLQLDNFRTLFGDERSDYALALQNYYGGGARSDWPGAHVSAYATAHPWEDWAETWAYYLRMVDVLETAYDVGFQQKSDSDLTLPEQDFDVLLPAWEQLTTAINAMNRSMGLADAYPFVLSAPAQSKLRFVHELILAGASAPGTRA